MTGQWIDALPWLAVLLLLLILLAIIATLGPSISGDHPAPPVNVLPPTEETTADCPRCGGTGVVDWLDDWDRPIAYDQECPACGGTGWMQVVF